MNLKLFLIPLFLLFVLSNTAKGQKAIQWNLVELMKPNPEVHVAGTPKIVEGKYGKALEFNGANDGFFLEEMPLFNLKQFTIEVLFKPESGGKFEQRFFHSGEIRGDRVLLEIRTTETDWYFDAFVKSGEQSKALIEPNFKHPLNKWYYATYVVDNGNLSTYVNGQKELEATIEFTPLKTGKTSLGVRLNEQSWFKGAIETIRITPKALKISNNKLN